MELQIKGRFLKHLTFLSCGIYQSYMFVKIMAMAWALVWKGLLPAQSITKEGTTYLDYG